MKHKELINRLVLLNKYVNSRDNDQVMKLMIQLAFIMKHRLNSVIRWNGVENFLGCDFLKVWGASFTRNKDFSFFYLNFGQKLGVRPIRRSVLYVRFYGTPQMRQFDIEPHPEVTNKQEQIPTKNR